MEERDLRTLTQNPAPPGPYKPADCHDPDIFYKIRGLWRSSAIDGAYRISVRLGLALPTLLQRPGFAPQRDAGACLCETRGECFDSTLN